MVEELFFLIYKVMLSNSHITKIQHHPGNLTLPHYHFAHPYVSSARTRVRRRLRRRRRRRKRSPTP